MKMINMFADRKVSKDEIKRLDDDTGIVRLRSLFGGDPEELLRFLKRAETLALEVRIAAGEGVLEFMDRRKAGKRTWRLSRWVDEALCTMMCQAKKSAID